jgi:hypothetical protein
VLLSPLDDRLLTLGDKLGGHNTPLRVASPSTCCRSCQVNKKVSVAAFGGRRDAAPAPKDEGCDSGYVRG